MDASRRHRRPAARELPVRSLLPTQLAARDPPLLSGFQPARLAPFRDRWCLGCSPRPAAGPRVRTGHHSRRHMDARGVFRFPLEPDERPTGRCLGTRAGALVASPHRSPVARGPHAARDRRRHGPSRRGAADVPPRNDHRGRRRVAAHATRPVLPPPSRPAVGRPGGRSSSGDRPGHGPAASDGRAAGRVGTCCARAFVP